MTNKMGKNKRYYYRKLIEETYFTIYIVFISIKQFYFFVILSIFFSFLKQRIILDLIVLCVFIVFYSKQGIRFFFHLHYEWRSIVKQFVRHHSNVFALLHQIQFFFRLLLFWRSFVCFSFCVICSSRYYFQFIAMQWRIISKEKICWLFELFSFLPSNAVVYCLFPFLSPIPDPLIFLSPILLLVLLLKFLYAFLCLLKSLQYFYSYNLFFSSLVNIFF